MFVKWRSIHPSKVSNEVVLINTEETTIKKVTVNLKKRRRKYNFLTLKKNSMKDLSSLKIYDPNK